MTAVVFYFQVHQPYRLARFSRADVGGTKELFDDPLNEFVMKRVAERCYLPMNQVLLDAIEATDGRFRCCFSISGTALEQAEAWAPEVLDSFRELFATGAVELACETSQHSLAAVHDPIEFQAQVATQRKRIKRLFDLEPRTFRNTELILDEAIAKAVEELGFKTLLGEGADQLLGWRVPYVPYRARGTESLNLLLRAYPYSDDIAFRFSNTEWAGYPLMADTFAGWLDEVPEEAPFVGLFMDYETFGEHQSKDTGIFDFMRTLPGEVLKNPRLSFATPDEITSEHPATDELAFPRLISWADAERDVSAWLGNHMQRAASDRIWSLAPKARAALEIGRPELHAAWRKLSTSDHTYYMSTKYVEASDGDVHEYFSPYDSPHEAFMTTMNVADDLAGKLDDALSTTPKTRKRS